MGMDVRNNYTMDAAVEMVVIIIRIEYYIHSTGQFGGVYAFGYNSAESERIWTKSGGL